EIDGLFYPLGISRLAREVEFADAAVRAAFEFLLHEVEDEGVAEPGLDVGTDAIRPDERHDLQARRLGVNKGMRAGVRAAGREDARDAVLFEQRQHLIDAVIGLWLPIVVQVRVEDFDRLVRTGRAARGDKGERNQNGDVAGRRAYRPPERHYSAATTCGRSPSPVSSSCGSSLRRRRRSMRSR